MKASETPNGPPEAAAKRRAAYLAVLAGLRVESNPRYQRGRGQTYCNLFVVDATRALGALIPAVVQTPGAAARFLTANAKQDWLRTEGAQLGWRRLPAEDAQQAANAGQPTVATWKNRESGQWCVRGRCQCSRRLARALRKPGRKNLNRARRRLDLAARPGWLKYSFLLTSRRPSAGSRQAARPATY